IQSKLSQLYRSAHLPTRDAIVTGTQNEKFKIGFISTFFNDHTIGKLNRGIIANLSRDAFTVTVFSIGHHNDNISRL
ncbi:MAG: hypothetical protein O2V44_10680, partial [Candidatus Bathyarchaeota archaeon]|nr:hypothetical protein [Candidatus Bathyarchaeota archaeon]